jgi:hypothetical protein
MLEVERILMVDPTTTQMQDKGGAPSSPPHNWQGVPTGAGLMRLRLQPVGEGPRRTPLRQGWHHCH